MDDVCAACRTEAGVNHECQACGFEFCDAHAAPDDHDCPAIDTSSGVDSTGSGNAGSDAGDTSAPRSRTATTRGSAAASRASAAASTARALLARGRNGIERGVERGLDRAGRDATDRQTRLASIALVVLLLVLTSAVLLGTSGIVADGLSDGGSADAPTNELVAGGNDSAALESPAAFDEALLAEVNAARDEAGVTRLETDDELAQVAADHSADMADAESASLDAWDQDRLIDRLEGTDTPCETVAQTGAWIDAGGETDADALASDTVDRWLDDDSFRAFLSSGDHDRGAIASVAGDDGRRYVSITVCGS